MSTKKNPNTSPTALEAAITRAQRAEAASEAMSGELSMLRAKVGEHERQARDQRRKATAAAAFLQIMSDNLLAP